MAYCELEDVQKLLKWFTIDSNSKITSDEVTNSWIPEADETIDAKLQRVYTVPITNADDIEILKYISCRIVACEMAHVLVLQANGKISDIVMRWCTQAKDRLDAILNQEILLPNSDLLDSADGGRLYSFTAHGNDTYDAPDPIWYLNASSTKINQW